VLEYPCAHTQKNSDSQMKDVRQGEWTSKQHANMVFFCSFQMRVRVNFNVVHVRVCVFSQKDQHAHIQQISEARAQHDKQSTHDKAHLWLGNVGEAC
jgi:hypothetical protein